MKDWSILLNVLILLLIIGLFVYVSQKKSDTKMTSVSGCSENTNDLYGQCMARPLAQALGPDRAKPMCCESVSAWIKYYPNNKVCSMPDTCEKYWG